MCSSEWQPQQGVQKSCWGKQFKALEVPPLRKAYGAREKFQGEPVHKDEKGWKPLGYA